MPPTFEDGLTRCAWVTADPDYRHYHDTEWGMPLGTDTALFERISLEGFQSGLSWLTILRKREAFRAAFAGFDIDRLARFDNKDVERLLQDASIIRHRGKIDAVLNNAHCAIALRKEAGSLAAFLWRYAPPETLPTTPVRATCPESIALSKALKARGWKFVGPTTLYALMQATGMVNDHAADCAYRGVVHAARAAFVRPADARPLPET
ncbi:DNA-3-methyladenine glycosylase I [Pigmentiphaga litoralis]|uniref:DNA-3-methyladenine glycosylase I n=1 Tax=Pigmentiphaga litoralis TaxID=516702 RepID=UPI003B429F9B